MLSFCRSSFDFDSITNLAVFSLKIKYFIASASSFWDHRWTNLFDKKMRLSAESQNDLKLKMKIELWNTLLWKLRNERNSSFQHKLLSIWILWSTHRVFKINFVDTMTAPLGSVVHEKKSEPVDREKVIIPPPEIFKKL